MLNAKKKICNECDTEQVIWKNHNGYKYCKQCWLKKSLSNTKTPILKTIKSIKSKSDKMSALDQTYMVLRRKFLETNPGCQAKLNDCSLQATDVHHKKGRGEYYLDKSTWLAVCRSCHSWIELHPIEAKQLGFSNNRLNDYE
jgi:hypothetical protein